MPNTIGQAIAGRHDFKEFVFGGFVFLLFSIQGVGCGRQFGAGFHVALDAAPKCAAECDDYQGND
ncbi:hypothetical protein BG841_14165 [Marinobacter sp. X15-166B]|nr:hypothetical protein BG841_14165 [Marinobacter sp. X15-166B]